MLLRIALANTDAKENKTIEHLLTKAAIIYDYEIDIAKFDNDFQNLENNIKNIDIAFLNYSVLSDNIDKLKNLYLKNKNCLMVPVGDPNEDICKFLSLRPGGHLNSAIDYDALESLCNDCLKNLDNASWLLFFKTRKGCFNLSIESILYCQSDLKYVEIITDDGKKYRKTGKLDFLLQELPESFAHVHKSYAVNLKRVSHYDKVNKLLFLDNGFSVPVSRAYADFVLSRF